MIDYTLAEQLKNAGFPSGSGEDYISTGPFEQWLYPTLPELMDACGEENFSIHKVTHTENTGGIPVITKSWGVELYTSDPDKDEYFSGSTPEEAVARLWLALNPKKEV